VVDAVGCVVGVAVGGVVVVVDAVVAVVSVAVVVAVVAVDTASFTY
jgi:hypothetical protein